MTIFSTEIDIESSSIKQFIEDCIQYYCDQFDESEDESINVDLGEVLKIDETGDQLIETNIDKEFIENAVQTAVDQYIKEFFGCCCAIRNNRVVRLTPQEMYL